MQPQAMTFSDYAAIEAMNFSTLKGGLTSARAMKHLIDGKQEDSDLFGFGRALHCRLLEPSEFDVRFVGTELTRNKRHAAYQEFLAEHPGKTVLKQSDMDKIDQMATAVLSHPAVAGLTDDLKYFERVLQWENDRGMRMKARLDSIGAGLGVVELKGPADIHPKSYPSKAYRLGYAMQAAIQIEGLAKCMPDVPRVHTTVCVEKSAPHDVVVYTASAEWLALGREQYGKCCDMYLQCSESGVWPGLAEEPIEIAPPHWAVVESDTFFDAEDQE